MYDLADAPDDVKKPLFIDQAHVAGLCNEVIAKRILEILQADVCNDPPPSYIGLHIHESNSRLQEQISRDSQTPAGTKNLTNTKRSVWRRTWDGWLGFAHLIGTVQMVVVLTIVYWVFIPLVYLPFGLIADPLRLRKSAGSHWLEREEPEDILEHMRQQG